MGASEQGRSESVDDTLGRVLVHLREIERLSGWSRTNAIGELILNSLFRGAVQVWRSRARDKCGSLRRLAAHPDCPLRKTALSDAVNCYLFFRENPRISELHYVTPGHVTVALRAGDAKAVALLEEAEKGQWGIRQLAALVGLEQSVGPDRSTVFSSLRRVERRFARVATLLGSLAVCEPFEARELAASLQRIGDQLHSVSELIGSVERSGSEGARRRSEIAGLKDGVGAIG